MLFRSSLFQSLGVVNTTWRPVVRGIGAGLAWVIALAFISVPVSVQLKLITLAV